MHINMNIFTAAKNLVAIVVTTVLLTACGGGDSGGGGSGSQNYTDLPSLASYIQTQYPNTVDAATLASMSSYTLSESQAISGVTDANSIFEGRWNDIGNPNGFCTNLNGVVLNMNCGAGGITTSTLAATFDISGTSPSNVSSGTFISIPGPTAPQVSARGNIKVTFGLKQPLSNGLYPFMLVFEGIATRNGTPIYDQLAIGEGTISLAITAGKVTVSPCQSAQIHYKQTALTYLPGYTQQGGIIPTVQWPMDYDAFLQPVSGTVAGCVAGTTPSLPPTLNSIAVSPTTPSLLVGGTQQLTATGSFSNATTANMSNSVNWISSNTAVATVSSTGLITAVGAGTATIIAEMGRVTSGSTSVTVGNSGGTNNTAAAYFTKTTVGNSWTLGGNRTNVSSISGLSQSGTIADTTQYTAVAAGVVTQTESQSRTGVPVNGTTPITTSGAIGTPSTRYLDATGNLVNTSSYIFGNIAGFTTSWIELPAIISAGASWQVVNSGGYTIGATIVGVGVTRTVPGGTFTDCIQINYSGTIGVTGSSSSGTYTMTAYYSPTVGHYVDISITENLIMSGMLNGTSNISITEQLQPGYIAH